MNHCKNGSALLLMLFCATFMVIVCTNVWKTATLLHNLSHAKQSYEQRFRATEGLLAWGIAAAKNKFDSNNHIFHGWPVGDFHSYDGSIELIKHNEEMMIRAQLMLNRELVCSLTCTLHKHRRIENDLEKFFFTTQAWIVE